MERNDPRRWLLDLVAELRYPVELLTAPELEPAINRRAPKFSAEQWSERLSELRRRGWIELRRFDDAPATITDEDLRAELSTRRHGLPDADTIYFGLTRDGGAEWESAARPDWNRYLFSAAGEHEVEIACADEARLEKFLRSPWLDWRPIGDERRDVLSPWQATYWKTLPLGHRMRCAYGAREDLAWTAEQYTQRNAWLADVNYWFTRAEL